RLAGREGRHRQAEKDRGRDGRPHGGASRSEGRRRAPPRRDAGPHPRHPRAAGKRQLMGGTAPAFAALHLRGGGLRSEGASVTTGTSGAARLAAAFLRFGLTGAKRNKLLRDLV